MTHRYRFIKEEKANHPVRTLCRVMQVSRSGFYDWQKRPLSERAQENAMLLAEIEEIFEASYKRYGFRRVLSVLLARGYHAGKHRVARLMRENGLFARKRRAFCKTTDSNHNYDIEHNKLNRAFTAAAPNQAWVGDITYIRTAEGWLYLAVLIDLFSRRVVGWAMSRFIDTKLALDALDMALTHRQPEPGFIHHTDRGSQYAANDYQDELDRAQATVSMSRKGNCWDNAPSESFFSTLKTELIYREEFATREAAQHAILRYLMWYNAHRIHSFNDYVSPMQFERFMLTRDAAA
ncbi:transposase InsO family protein [Bradymonas sediminis]|nr:transposase InsO family protein [Bradymonas sediminis]